MIKGNLTARHGEDEWRKLLFEALGSEAQLRQAGQTNVQTRETAQRHPPDNSNSNPQTAPSDASGQSSQNSTSRVMAGSSNNDITSTTEASPAEQQPPTQQHPPENLNSSPITAASAPPEQPSNNSASRATDSSSNNDIESAVETSPPGQQPPVDPGQAESEREAQEVTENPQQAARVRARREQAHADAIALPAGSRQAGDREYAERLKQRQEAARRERERIMRLVENDKLERKERAERRKMLVRSESDKSIENSGSKVGTSSSDTKEIHLSSTSKKCALQVRLLDGTTLRSHFSSDQTLSKDVRSWIDSKRTDGDAPYNFKQILSPPPNRTLSISDEQETLASLGLTPNATLILFPVLSGYTNAYDGTTTASGLLSKGLSAGYGVVSSGVGMITGALGSLFGVGGQTQTQPSNTNESRTVGSSSAAQQHSRSIRVKTLHDQAKEREDQQYYNGNQVGFVRLLCFDTTW